VQVQNPGGRVKVRSERHNGTDADCQIREWEGTLMAIKGYMERREIARQAKVLYRSGFWIQVKRWVREKVPWIIILVLLYHLFKLKLNFFSVKFKDYKDKAISIANSIKVENSLDFKFLLFSQFMRLLFSTIAIPWTPQKMIISFVHHNIYFRTTLFTSSWGGLGLFWYYKIV